MDRPVCDESHASGQPCDAHDRDPDDRRVASALRRRLVQDRLVAAPGRALRPRLDLSVHRPRLRRQATRALQGPALPLRRTALVVREDPGPCVNYRPQLAQLVKQPADGPEWLHELKYDGYRIGCAIERGRATLISRNGNDWTAQFPEIAKAAAALRVKSALLDGEVCMVLPDGRTSFQALQNAFNGGSRQGLVYFVFDLLYLGGRNLMPEPLDARKTALARVIGKRTRGRIRYAGHIEGRGRAASEHACRLGLDGIVSKRRDQPYQPGKRGGWVKTKCVKRQEFVVGGFTDPEGSRQGIGALLVGYYDGDRLVFAGKVGTGFSVSVARDLRARLEKIETPDCPF